MEDTKSLTAEEKQEEYYIQQIALRDKLIIRLLEDAEPPCTECALKNICVNGAKYETCARGLLAAIQQENVGEA